MLVLAFNVLSKNISLALLQNGELLQEKNIDIESKHSELLISSIEELLGSQDIWYSDLDLIATVTSPGSFTSCRIAQVVAKMMKISLQIPVAMLGLEDILADKFVDSCAGNLVVFLEGGMSEFYVARFLVEGGSCKKIEQTSIMKLSDLYELLLSRESFCIGSGKKFILDLMEGDIATKNIKFLNIDDDKISACDIAEYAFVKFQNNELDLSAKMGYLRQPRIEKKKK